MVAYECHLVFIALLDLDIIVSPLEIYFGKHFSSFELIDKLGNEREGVIVFYCMLV